MYNTLYIYYDKHNKLQKMEVALWETGYTREKGDTGDKGLTGSTVLIHETGLTGLIRGERYPN